jgi:hypothetical protein
MPQAMDAIRASYRIVQATSVHARAMASDIGPDPPLALVGGVGPPRTIEAAAAGSRTQDEMRDTAEELARRRAAREMWARDMVTLAERAGSPEPDPTPPAFTYRIGPDGWPYAIGDPSTTAARDRGGEPEIRGPTHEGPEPEDAISLVGRPTRGDPPTDDPTHATAEADEAPQRTALVRQAYASAAAQGAAPTVEVVA